MDEKNGELGKGFSVAVARAWEHELFSAPTPVRKVALRMSIVLGAGGGAISPFVNLARMGFGGRMGDGRQMFSWIHIADVIRAIIHIYENPEISGPVNIASPYPVTNDEMMRQVRAALGRRFGVPTPRLDAGVRGSGHPHRGRVSAQEPLGCTRGARGQHLPLSVSDVGVGAEPDRSGDPARVASGFTRLKFGCDRNRSHDILLEQIVIQCNRSL